MADDSITTDNATELTATQVASILTEPLEQASTFLGAGPRIIDTAGPLRLPAAPDSLAPDLGFTGEAEQIPEHRPDFGELSLLPSTMQSVKVITRYSNELARQSVISLDQALRDRLVSDVAARLDRQFYSDSGNGSDTPRGMFSWGGTQSVNADGGLSLDVLLEAQEKALSAFVDVTKLRLFVRPSGFAQLRRERDGQDRFQLVPDATAGNVPSVLGMPLIVSAHIPEGKAAVADMSQVAVARDLAPSVTLLSERYADTDEQAIRVVARYDAGPTQPPAVVTIDGIK